MDIGPDGSQVLGDIWGNESLSPHRPAGKARESLGGDIIGRVGKVRTEKRGD
ncbi:MAG: hypothetical protein LBP92_12015 [Deltaproteobacteria bacterium]|jgi:hypothetical protein|nr:hypothetical protein [Deltaproteobacteria bacterium]